MGLPGAGTGHSLTIKEESPELRPVQLHYLETAHKIIPGSKGQAPVWLELAMPKGLQDYSAGKEVVVLKVW